MNIPHVTPVAWPRRLERYGAPDTYRLSAVWLRACGTVSDWGGASGAFAEYLPSETSYRNVDGTLQAVDQVLADLALYREASDGILLRHVLDNTDEWEPILANAMRCFRDRMAVVTFTPDAEVTTKISHKNGWPTWNFNPADLRAAMAPHLVGEMFIQTSHPERIYYLEKACAS